MPNQVQVQNHFLFNNTPELFTAINYHRTHKNKRIRFNNRFFLTDLYTDKNPYIVLKKSTQMGATEWLVLNAILKAERGRGIFYVLPTYNLVSRFVKNRVDRTIENTPYYGSLLKVRYSKFSESMSLKHIGPGAIAFVGSNSSSGFVEFPADDVIIDELDECDQENLPMADERLSASTDKRWIKVGNPTTKGFGIDQEFNDTDMKEWNIPCSNCGEWIYPDFFTHVVKEVKQSEYVILDPDYDPHSGNDIKAICHKCEKPFNPGVEGEWIGSNQYSSKSGYHISKMFSTEVTIKELVDRFNKGLTDDTVLQRFYNGDLGVAYTASGSKITIEMLDACVKDYLMPVSCKNTCVMGIDVGSKLNIRISEILPSQRLKAVFVGTIPNDMKSFKTIADLYRIYHVKIGCIDADPEINLAKNICRLKGMFRVHFKEVKKDIIDIKNKIISIDRTTWCDYLKSKIMTKAIYFPKNIKKMKPLDKSGVSEYYYHMTNSTRIHDEKKDKYKWVEGNLPDHYMFSEILTLVAKKLIMKIV